MPPACCLLPGFIDTHVHNTQQLGPGLADECDIPKQLLERLYGYESEMTSEDAYWAAKMCHLELIRAGTTCFLDPSSYYPEETARAAGETGMRGIGEFENSRAGAGNSTSGTNFLNGYLDTLRPLAIAGPPPYDLSWK